MDIIDHFLPTLIIVLKIVTLVIPLALPVIVIRRQKKAFNSGDRAKAYMNIFALSGGLFGMVVGGAVQLYRSGLPMGALINDLVTDRATQLRAAGNAIHPPYPTSWSALHNGDEAFARFTSGFWNHAYFTFWTDAINPLKQPLTAALTELAMAPRANGAIFLGILLMPTFLAVGWLLLKRQSIQTFLVLTLLASCAGYYLAVLIFWGGPLILAVAVPGGFLWLLYQLKNAVGFYWPYY